ncbi:hypothetical protein FA15DRAFT_670211 [Coprinopsis marcescibilis]|uniref:Uncharacterized protein n=1 Tax=Coprinopsis marcescibilis TaxID=230819 RepID=A0A5C3KV52_COPMA|nr:hypothetical protein FA15DRAFT_670211 [Coprinopsis marcescibilis]
MNRYLLQSLRTTGRCQWRRTNPPPTRKSIWNVQTHKFSSLSTKTTVSRIGPQTRWYATSNSDGNPPKAVENSEQAQDQPPWIDVLENTSNGPWLTQLVSEEKLRLQLAHGLIYQMILYLNQPSQKKGDLEAGAQFLSLFQTAKVPANSEIARARTAFAKLTRAIVLQIATISLDSPFRKAHPEIFDVTKTLMDIQQKHLDNVDDHHGFSEDWSAFWEASQPVLVDLFEKLDGAGFNMEPVPDMEAS